MIHQVVPVLHRSDAVGQHTAAVQDALAGRGMTSEVFVELEDPQTAARTRPFADYPQVARPGDVLVYQFATASAMVDAILARRETLIVNYHNVTPPESFAPWDNALARHQLWARRQLRELAGRAALGVAVSETNRADLVEAGFARTAVVPPVMRMDPAGGDLRPGHHRGARWLAVGRLAPNKAVEDVIAALFAYRMVHDPEAVLLVIGRPAVPAYARALRRYAADLGVVDAVRFAGTVDADGLAAAYDHADVLLVLSDHEGFCLPLTEAMARRVPVVAYRQGAVPEVLGDAGVLLDVKDPLTVAAAVRRLAIDDAWRHERAMAGVARLEALDLGRSAERLVDLVVSLHDGASPPASGAGREAASAPAPSRRDG